MIQEIETKAFIYRPVITFADTNVVGNVYFAHFVKWQGACREKFLISFCPDTLQLVKDGNIVLHTTSVSCIFKDPIGITVGEEIRIEMRLVHLRGGRLTMKFGYFSEFDRREIAIGEQKVCCKKKHGDGLVGTVFPNEMLLALKDFASDKTVVQNIRDAISFQSTSTNDSMESSILQI